MSIKSTRAINIFEEISASNIADVFHRKSLLSDSETYPWPFRDRNRRKEWKFTYRLMFS